MQLGKKNTIQGVIFTLLLTAPSLALALGGNTYNDSFNKAKRTLLRDVYSKIPKETIYCGATFKGKRIIDPNGFSSTKFTNRAHKLEWEHIVPAENFGRAFPQWRHGHEKCVNGNGQPFKGRNCASKVSKTFRYMFADMYNLAPAIGAVNALRSNYRFVAQANAVQGLGQCSMKIDPAGKGKAEPPKAVKGFVARTYLYMDGAYPSYRMGRRKLFEAWDKEQPVTKNECKRAKRIEAVQHNANKFVKTPCIRAGLWK